MMPAFLMSCLVFQRRVEHGFRRPLFVPAGRPASSTMPNAPQLSVPDLRLFSGVAVELDPGAFLAGHDDDARPLALHPPEARA